MPASRSPKPFPARTSMVLVPSELILLRICCCEPAPSAEIAATEAIPMMMPSMVRSERILCAQIAAPAIRKASVIRSIAPRQPAPGACSRMGRAVTADLDILRSSEMITPSLISTTRSACSAIFLS
ncbi:hypothetical protein D3C71_1505300 [compost metagenome]